MKVLHICTSKSWGGMEMHVSVLADAQRQAGLQAEVVCAPGSKLARDADDRKIPVWTIGGRGYVRPGAIRACAQILAKRSPDVVHAHYSKDLWWLVPALRKAQDLPLLLTKHIGTQNSKRDPLHSYLYRRVDAVIAISDVIRRNVVETHPVPAALVHTVHHGLNTRHFDPARFDRREVRAALGYGDDNLVLGIIGRLQRSKGYAEFFEAAAELAPQFPEARFLLVGEASRGEDREADEVLGLIDSFGLRDRVNWIGFQQDVPRVLAAMDIFVFPSHAEAFGLVLIEAMAMQKPVISSASDGVVDIVEDGASGLLVPPKDAKLLAAACRRLMESPELRQRLASNARKRVDAEFRTEKMVAKIRELYRAAVKS